MNRTEDYFNTVMKFFKVLNSFLPYFVIFIENHINYCHTLTVNIFLVRNAHHITVTWPNMPAQPVSRWKFLMTVWRVLGQSWAYLSKRSFGRKEKWRFYMENKTRWFLTLFMGDFHMLWNTTANTAANVKKPQTSDVIGFAVHK
jgi:hypothetical protein